MEFRRTRPTRQFFATGGGAGLVETMRCRHDLPILSLHLFSEQPGQASDDIGILMTECLAPELLGLIIAHVQAAAGPEAGEQFLTDMLATRDQALQQLADRAATPSAPACCEAGHASGGLEHTCSHNTTS
ncbi:MULTISPECIES: hypothetical protein [Streptomyces]